MFDIEVDSRSAPIVTPSSEKALWLSVVGVGLSCQPRSLARQEHGRTIPLPDMPRPLKKNLRGHWNQQSRGAFQADAARSSGRNDLLACSRGEFRGNSDLTRRISSGGTQVAISFKANGGSVSVDAPEDTPLLWVISRAAQAHRHKTRLRCRPLQRLRRAHRRQARFRARPRSRMLQASGRRRSRACRRIHRIP